MWEVVEVPEDCELEDPAAIIKRYAPEVPLDRDVYVVDLADHPPYAAQLRVTKRKRRTT